MHKIWLKSLLASVLIASSFGFGSASASAMPLLARGTAAPSVVAPDVEKAWYRCGYYRCYHRYYGYYRPYRYYYGGYYRPHLGIRLGGIGLGLY